jgi:hypothetical protein
MIVGYEMLFTNVLTPALEDHLDLMVKLLQFVIDFNLLTFLK